MSFFSKFFESEDVDEKLHDEAQKRAVADKKAKALRQSAWNLSSTHKEAKSYRRLTNPDGVTADALGRPPSPRKK